MNRLKRNIEKVIAEENQQKIADSYKQAVRSLSELANTKVMVEIRLLRLHRFLRYI